MSAIDPLVEGVRLLDELLVEPMLEPDAARTDWASLEGRLRLVANTVRKGLVESLPAALEEPGLDRVQVRERVATLLGQAAALLHAAGDPFECDRLLARAAEIAPEGSLRDELVAGRRDPAAYGRLNHARWSYAHGRSSRAKASVSAVLKETQEEALKKAAREAGRAPRPLASAPALFRLNGFGVGLYGSRDARPDGSYVATYCVSALWIPILPLTAYRVRKEESDRYQFFTREPLGGVARAWQAALLVAFLAVGGYAGVRAYLESPARLARVGTEEGQRLEKRGKSSEAMARYLATVSQFAGRADVKPAAEGVLRLAAASVKEPCRPQDVPVVGRVVTAYDRLPAAARSGAPAAYLSSRLLAWSEQLGTRDPEHLRAALSVLDLAAPVTHGADAATVTTRRNTLRRALADALVAADRPVDALHHYLLLGDAAALQSAQDAIASFGDSPSLWAEAAPEVRQWILRAAKVAERQTTASEFKARLEQAEAASAAAAAVIETGNENRIAASFVRAPRDQSLAVSLAGLRRGRGDARGCVSILAAQGSPGHMISDAQQLLGACVADAGELHRADDVLSAFLGEHLPPFLRARRDYTAAASELERRLVEEAQRGVLPADLRQAIETVPESEKAEVFQKWLAQTLSKDARLDQLRSDYLRHRAVVGASLTLGSVKLRRAGETHGEERRAHLEGAERAFLSIREEAEGAPGFHLGLGQVFYRLGKIEEGAKELNGLLDRNEPELTLQVARAYRELGLESRTREIAEALHRSATTPQVKLEAAFTRALVPLDLDDQELWLQRSDPQSLWVKTRLLETRGFRLLSDGKNAEADRSFAQAADFYDRRSAHESAAANNAAIAFMARYSATGDLAHMRTAVARLETSARLEPDNAILLGNLVDALDFLSRLAVLERWLKTRNLLLSGQESGTLMQAIRNGPRRDELLQAIRDDPSFQRQMEVTRQEQILAPQKPGPYARRLGWLRWNRDTAGLQALLRLLEQVPGIDQGDPEERKRWRAGAKDAQYRAEAQKDMRRSEERLKRVVKVGHAPTTGAAFLLHAEKLDTLAFYDPSPEAYALAVEAHRRALSEWPELGAEGLSDAFVKIAAWRAAASNPNLKAALDKDRRIYDISMVLHRAATGPDGAEVLAALRRQPEIAEAARLRHAPAQRLPGLTDWIVGRLSGDAVLEEAAARVFAREDLALSLAVDVKLGPASESDQADLAIFTANRPR